MEKMFWCNGSVYLSKHPKTAILHLLTYISIHILHSYWWNKKTVSKLRLEKRMIVRWPGCPVILLKKPNGNGNKCASVSSKMIKAIGSSNYNRALCNTLSTVVNSAFKHQNWANVENYGYSWSLQFHVILTLETSYLPFLLRKTFSLQLFLL